MSKPRYALLGDNGAVVTVTESETLPPWGVWQPCDATIGPSHRFDGTAFVLMTSPAPLRRITPRAMRQRFTAAERVTIEIAKIDDPSAPMTARQQAAALRAYMDDVTAAQYIDLDDPSTVAGVQSLEAAGLIATGRAADILGQDPQPGEQP